MKPTAGAHPHYYNPYIEKVKDDDLLKAFETTRKEVLYFLKQLKEDMGDFTYAENKWTVKELLLHICDSERIFSYRALRFARGDQQQPLPYDENLYAANCNAKRRSLASVIEEYEAVNHAAYLLFKTFSEEDLQKTGNTAIGTTTVNALGFVICGHTLHHIGVLKERYLKVQA